MKILPKVSVIIPTYNRSEFILRSVNSALEQTAKNIEVIVVDDASSDNTKEIIKNITDRRLKYLRQSQNSGAPAARNLGLKHSTGEYICFLDSDDEILPTKLQKQLDVFEKLKVRNTIVYCGFCYVLEKTNEIAKTFTPEEHGDIYHKILENNCIGSPTPLIPRECFDKSGVFDESLKSCQDWDMWIRLAKYYNFQFIPDCLAKVYIHGNQISTNLQKKIDARTRILQKYKDDIQLDISTFSWHLRRLGFYNCINGMKSDGRHLIIESIKVDPTNWRGYIHMLLSYLPFDLSTKLILKYTTTKINHIQLYA